VYTRFWMNYNNHIVWKSIWRLGLEICLVLSKRPNTRVIDWSIIVIGQCGEALTNFLTTLKRLSPLHKKQFNLLHCFQHKLVAWKRKLQCKLFFFFLQHEFFLLHALATTFKLFFFLVAQKKELQCKLASQKKEEEEMQCNVSLLHGKNIEEEFFFFLVTMQRKDFFSFSMCIFYNATFFFLSMHICYNANLLHRRRKRSTLTSSSFATTQKKSYFLLIACFFGFFLATIFLFFVACNCLVTWNKKKKHACASFSCYNISYVIYFMLYFSSIPLFFWLWCFLMHP